MDNKENQWFTGRGCKMLRELGIKEDTRIVDFGSGKGRYTVPLSQAVGRGHVLSIERDPGEVKILKERLEAFGNPDAVTVINHDSLLLESLEDDSVHGVLAFDVLQYVDDWKALFITFKRILKADGAVYIYPAALPHPGAVVMSAVFAAMEEAGFSHSDDRIFHMMHNKDRVDDRVYMFHLRND